MPTPYLNQMWDKGSVLAYSLVLSILLGCLESEPGIYHEFLNNLVVLFSKHLLLCNLLGLNFQIFIQKSDNLNSLIFLFFFFWNCFYIQYQVVCIVGMGGSIVGTATLPTGEEVYSLLESPGRVVSGCYYF